jgi:hypothetical protein
MKSYRNESLKYQSKASLAAIMAWHENSGVIANGNKSIISESVASSAKAAENNQLISVALKTASVIEMAWRQCGETRRKLAK